MMLGIGDATPWTVTPYTGTINFPAPVSYPAFAPVPAPTATSPGAVPVNTSTPLIPGVSNLVLIAGVGAIFLLMVLMKK